MEVLSELYKPFVVILVLLSSSDELGQAGHHGGHGPPGVLVRVLGVQAVVLQGAPPLSQPLVTSILKILNVFFRRRGKFYSALTFRQ